MKISVTEQDYASGRVSHAMCPVALAVNRMIPADQFAWVSVGAISIYMNGNQRPHYSEFTSEGVRKAIKLYDMFGERTIMEFELPDLPERGTDKGAND